METDTLNTVENIERNIRTANERMAMVDAAIGDERLGRFAVAMSKLFRHMNPTTPSAGLLSNAALHPRGSEFSMYLSSACIELQTGWNNLRLGTVPGAMRATRVAVEFVAVGTLIVLPTKVLRKLQWTRAELAALKREHWKLFAVCNVSKGPDGMKPPVVRGTRATTLFFDCMKGTIGVDNDVLSVLLEYRNALHHPFAHGSTEVWSQHFFGFDGRAAGRTYAPEREPMYRDCADGITHTTILLDECLNAVARFLATNI